MNGDTHRGLSLSAAQVAVTKWGLDKEYWGSSFDVIIHENEIIIREQKR